MGWTGLPQFGGALQAAQAGQVRIEIELVLVMLLGSVTSAWSLGHFGGAREYLRRLPIYIIGFSILTPLVAWLAVEIAVWIRRPVV